MNSFWFPAMSVQQAGRETFSTAERTMPRSAGRRAPHRPVGDNPETDIGMAQKMGLETFHYENTTVKGRPYRTDEISGHGGQRIPRIVNNHLHNGYRRYDAYYEFGFLYGGPFHYGFAQHIHRFAAEHGMEKDSLVARDGYIMKQIYDGCFLRIFPPATCSVPGSPT